MSVVITGTDEVHRMLAKGMDPSLKKSIQKATNAGAKYLKPKAQAEAPVRTGKLRKAIGSGQAKRGRPASIVKVHKRAFYDHMVTGGTKPHRIRFPDQKAAGIPSWQGNIKHPGARANPFFERVADRYGNEALDIVEKTLAKELDA